MDSIRSVSHEEQPIGELGEPDRPSVTWCVRLSPALPGVPSGALMVAPERRVNCGVEPGLSRHSAWAAEMG